MKKILFTTFLMLAVFTFYSCNVFKKKLQSEIETANKECPIDLGKAGEISSFEFDEETDEVIITMLISEEMPLNVSALKKLEKTLKKYMLGTCAKSDVGMTVVKELAMADAKFSIVMQPEGSVEILKINVSKDEIKDLAEGKIAPISSRDMLDMMVASKNAQCPIQMDEFAVLSSISIEGSDLVCNYSIDENSVSLEALEQNNAALKAELKELVSSQDPMMKRIVSLCKEANVGIAHRYVGKVTGKACVIKLGPSEF